MQCWKQRVRSGSSLLAISFAFALAHTASGATIPIVEFYNAAQNHYFMTGSPGEIDDLDGGVHPGWQRTDFSFDADDRSLATAHLF